MRLLISTFVIKAEEGNTFVMSMTVIASKEVKSMQNRTEKAVENCAKCKHINLKKVNKDNIKVKCIMAHNCSPAHAG